MKPTHRPIKRKEGYRKKDWRVDKNKSLTYENPKETL